MALRPQQLPGQLQNGLAPIYLIAGSETLLLQECRDLVIQAAQSQGFVERSVHEVVRGFDWDQMGEESASLSLFSSRKILDIRIPSGKPGQDGAKALVKMAENPDPDVLVLISCNQWDASSRKSKWASTLGKVGVAVEIWPVKPHEMPGWVKQRMGQAGLRAEPAAIAMLAEMVEGNLLAAQQEIDKLVMRGSEEVITTEIIEQAVADSSRFDSFRLVECALAGKLGESLRVATGLKRTGVVIQVVLGALARELTIAAAFIQARAAGESDSAAFGRLRVWQSRQGAMKAAASRLTVRQFDRVLSTLSLIDRMGKGQAQGDAWHTLDHLLWFMCEPSSHPWTTQDQEMRVS